MNPQFSNMASLAGAFGSGRGGPNPAPPRTPRATQNLAAYLPSFLKMFQDKMAQKKTPEQREGEGADAMSALGMLPGMGLLAGAFGKQPGGGAAGGAAGGAMGALGNLPIMQFLRSGGGMGALGGLGNFDAASSLALAPLRRGG